MDGKALKNIRKQLGLTQKDVATMNMSPNLISMIETNQVELTPQKALMLYRKYVEVSLIKAIPIDLNFDGLLKETQAYLALKKAYHICMQLNESLSNGESLSLVELEMFVSFAHRNDVGLASYFILVGAANCLDDAFASEKEKWLTDALEFLKWYPFEEVHDLYAKCLNDVTRTCFKDVYMDKLIGYTKYLIDQLNAHDMVVNQNLYYNVSLFYTQRKAYEEAYAYFMKYEEKVTHNTTQEKLEDLIQKGILHCQTNRVADGLALYQYGLKWLHGNKTEDLVRYRAMLLSNIIYEACTYKIDPYFSELNHYIQKLREIEDEVVQYPMQLRSIYTNLGLGYLQLKDYHKASQYCSKSLEIVTSDDEKYEVLNSFYALGKQTYIVPDFVEGLTSLDYNKLSHHNKEGLLMLLVEVALNPQFNDSHSMLTRYIIQLREV